MENSNVGSNINFLVVSESALVPKSTIDYLVPSVFKIGGKILQISTPRLGSHFNKLFTEDLSENLIKHRMTAYDIYDNDGKRIYTDEELNHLRSIMSKEKFETEFMTNMTSASEASIYSRSIDIAQWDSDVQYDRNSRIFVSLDLGVSDNSALTFFKYNEYDGTSTVVHSYRNRLQATKHYIDYVENWLNERNLSKSQVSIILPNDAKSLIDNDRYVVSRVNFWEDRNFRVISLNPFSVIRGIELTRTVIQNGQLRFLNEPTVKDMLEVLKAYEWKRETTTNEILYIPNHGKGFAPSNTADSLEYGVITLYLDEYERNNTTQSEMFTRNIKW